MCVCVCVCVCVCLLPSPAVHLWLPLFLSVVKLLAACYPLSETQGRTEISGTVDQYSMRANLRSVRRRIFKGATHLKESQQACVLHVNESV